VTLSTTLDLTSIDFAHPDTFVRPDMDEVWQVLRDEHPVHRQPDTGGRGAFWVLSRYADVLAMYKDDERLLSGPGNMLESLLKPHGDPAAGKVLVMTDNPRHSAIRTMLLKAFTPRIRQFVVERLEQRVGDLIASRVGTGSIDFATDVAEQIPIGTICDLLGFPATDHRMLLDLSAKALSSDDAGQTAEEMWLARNELLVYCSGLIEARRDEPQDDLLSALVTMRVGGEPLTDEEILLNCYGFLLAGDHTSRLAMITAVLNFALYPGQWLAVKDGWASPASAVEEIVRWASPVQHVARTAAVDFTMHGRTIRAGDRVTGWNVSANRDDRIFPRPLEFDVARTPNKHLGFGHGAHFCFGAYLGRAEVSAVVRTLAQRVREIQLTGEPKPLYSTFLRGYANLPVALV
jgi:cytochrome P450